MKKITFLLFAILLSMASTFAQYVDGGTTGPLTWQITGTAPNYTLTISGNGEMSDYNYGDAPWYSYRNNLKTLVMENGITHIGNGAFPDCSGFTGTLTIPNSVTTIGEGAFSCCSSFTGSLTIPNNVTTIEAHAFELCGFTGTLTIPNSVTTIGNNAFQTCSGFTGTLTIPNSVTSIERRAFVHCSGFTGSLTISNSVTTIGEEAFYYCRGLSSLTIGNSVTSIGNYAFRGCYSLTSITTYAETPPVLGNNVFLEVPKDVLVHVPCYTAESYMNAPGWGDYFTNIINLAGSYVPQLCMISVDENNHNEIVWTTQEKAESYNIYREGAQGGQYDLVANIDGNSLNSWVDMESNAKIRSYRYKISGIDDTKCGESLLSEPHKTMHLTINAGQSNSWNLIWTAYEGTEYATYNIYRTSGESIGDMELIGTMPAGNTSFSDFSAPEGYVYYVVEIMLNETCKVGKSGSSIKSNIATNNPNVSIVETLRATSLQIYPNPTTGELRIENGELRINNVEIFDIYGRNVGFKFPSNKLEGWQPQADGVVFNISHLQSGIYFVKITTDEGVVVKKVVKE